MDARGLTYRIAVEADYPFLVSLRVECGWGLPKLEKTWRDPNVVYCVLVLGPDPSGASGDDEPQGAESEDIGMGCWMLEHADKDMANRESKTVYLCMSTRISLKANFKRRCSSGKSTRVRGLVNARSAC